MEQGMEQGMLLSLTYMSMKFMALCSSDGASAVTGPKRVWAAACRCRRRQLRPRAGCACQMRR